MEFSRGDKVEVSSKQEGFVGSYYAATVIKNYGNEYAVQYKNLVAEDDQSRPLIERVDSNELRPRPPKVLATGFHALDVVDAFDNDGWWVGKISGRKGSDSYYVFFDAYRVEISYPSSCLRPHLEWVNGKWVSSKNSV